MDHPVRATAGWGQFSGPSTPRLREMGRAICSNDQCRKEFEMTKLIRTMMLAIFAVGFVTTACAQERATLEQAKAMVKKARAYIQKVGPEKAYAEISNPKGQFVDREIYIYVYDKNLNNLAHGGNQRLIGKNLADLRDTDGVYLNKGLLEVAQKGGGTFKFRFLNPATKTIEVKTGYAEMEGDVMVGSGVYAAQ
jgi:cytochrome c